MITWHDESFSTNWSFSFNAAHIIFDAIINALEFSKHVQKYNELILISFVLKFIKTAHYFTYVFVFWNCFTIIILWRLFIQYNVQWFMYIMNKMWLNNHMFRISYDSYFFINDVEVLLVWNQCSKSVDTNTWRWRFSSFEHENWRSNFIIFFVFIEEISWYMNVSYFLNFSCDCLNVSRHMKIYMYATKKNIRSIMSRKNYIFSFIFDRW